MWGANRRLTKAVRIAVGVVTLATGVAVVGNAGSAYARTHYARRLARPRRNRGVLFGDSLTYESEKDVRHHGKISVAAFPDTGPCDWNRWLPWAIAAYHPSIIALATVGDVSACMANAKGQLPATDSPTYLADYRAELGQFFTMATASGADVIFFEGPPMLNRTWNKAVSDIATIAEQEAPYFRGVTVSTAARNAVSNNGTYTAFMPCLKHEHKKKGCVDGRIDVRTTRGIQTGVHFCPDGLIATLNPGRACNQYSSGEERFGGAIAPVMIAGMIAWSRANA